MKECRACACAGSNLDLGSGSGTRTGGTCGLGLPGQGHGMGTARSTAARAGGRDGRDDFGREGDIRQERYTVGNTAGFMRCRKV